MQQLLNQVFIGCQAQANHPQTCLNPDKTFKIKEVKIEDDNIWFRGEHTCWFGSGMIEFISNNQTCLYDKLRKSYD